MRKPLLLAATVVALTAGLTACTAASDAETSTTPSASSSAAASTDDRTGTFSGLNEMKVAGTVTFEGGKLSLAGFSSDEAPDLHVYLTNGTDEAAVTSGKEVSAVAYDKASQTFDLKGIDTTSYTDVVIHCDKVKAVFGAAALS